MPWFHSGVWKNCKSHSTDLGIYEEEEKKKATWTGKWHYLWWGRGSWKPESRLKSLYPPLQTLFTQLWPNRAKSDRKTWTNSWSSPRGICDTWGHSVHVHTQTHTSVTETRAPPRQGGKAGPGCRDVRENKRDRVKLAARHETWDDWFTRGSKSSCSVREQVAVPSLSHCW